AGGCFWGLELEYQRVPGVLSTSVGYTQGKVEDPSYEDVCAGTTGHTEAVQVKYNPSVVTFKGLLDVFFSRVDVTALNRQGNDVGTQYRNGIYFHKPDQ
ncbi:peptide methionine sulfoxide reductase MsrA, partial [Baffinella frigidus]